MKQKKVTETTVLYNETEKKIIGVVNPEQQYATPDSTSVFTGTLEEFKTQNPDYT